MNDLKDKLLIRLEELEKQMAEVFDWMQSFSDEVNEQGADITEEDADEEEDLTGCRRTVRLGREL